MPEGAPPAPAGPGLRRRALLLGASNITFGLPWLIPAVEDRLGGAVDICGAWGHGRSYGEPSTLLLRTLRGVVHSNLWGRLETREPLETFALVTDVGNDIAFGEEPDAILAWVETVFDRLEAMEATVVVTGLPHLRLHDQSDLGFLVARTIFFPEYSMDRADILRKVDEVNARLADLARRRGHAFIEMEREWYWVDPIHIRFRRQGEAWERILRAWDPALGELARPRTTPLRAIDLYLRRPEEYHLLAEHSYHRQPCHRTQRGSAISMY